LKLEEVSMSDAKTNETTPENEEHESLLEKGADAVKHAVQHPGEALHDVEKAANDSFEDVGIAVENAARTVERVVKEGLEHAIDGLRGKKD
jgi:hypothetical protein